jgi:putative membrane fusion protein
MDDINGLIQKKAEIVGSKSTSDVFLNDLKKQKQSLQEQIDSNTREISAQSSGIVSYTVDGYEDVLNPNAIKTLTPKILDSIKNKEVPEKSKNNNVEASKPFMKIIKGIDCNVMVVLDSQKVKFIKEDDSVKIRINDINKTVNGTVAYKSNDIDGKRIISIRVDRGMSDMAGMRKINVDLIQNSYSGLKVPVKSLLETDLGNMKARIVLVKANYTSIRKVRIDGFNDQSAIIESFDETSENSVGLYDVYVVNPENIQEGQLISQ